MGNHWSSSAGLNAEEVLHHTGFAHDDRISVTEVALVLSALNETHGATPAGSSGEIASTSALTSSLESSGSRSTARGKASSESSLDSVDPLQRRWSRSISRKEFRKVVGRLKERYPHVKAFEDDNAEQCFRLFDIEHSGKGLSSYLSSAQTKTITVNPIELVAGVIILAKGTTEEKSELLFKSIDENGDGKLSREEVEHFVKTCLDSAQAKIVEEARKNGLACIFRANLKSSANALKPTVMEDFVKEIFSADTNGDGFISLEEFKEAARNSNNKGISKLLQPEELLEYTREHFVEAIEGAGVATKPNTHREITIRD